MSTKPTTINFALTEETLGYVTNQDPSNTDVRFLIAGSRDVLLDVQRKVRLRPGYTRLGAADTTNTPILNAWRWESSTGFNVSQRNWNGTIEAYLTTIDGTPINAWTKISGNTAFSASYKVRPALELVSSGGGIYDPGESMDLQIMCNHDTKLYEWGGGIAVVASSDGASTITKAGTTTFGQNRFYQHRVMVLVCVRTGTEYTYTGGVGTQTLTGVSTGDSWDLVAGDILVQKIVTNNIASSVGSTYAIDIVYPYLNQVVVASSSSATAYVSKNSGTTLNYTDFTFSSPRIAGEGALFTLTGPVRAVNSLGTYLLLFSGLSSVFRSNYQQITVNTTLAETLNVQKFDMGVRQGALQHESTVAIGNQLAYLTNEVALRIINNVQNLTGIDPKRYSNPIKPDFDAGVWTDAFGTWYENTLIFNDAAGGNLFMLNFSEDAQGRIVRFWNPPQHLPIGALSVIDSGSGPMLHGHSYAVHETYLLFDGLSDGQYPNMDPADKIAIHGIAKFAYNHYGRRELLKTFDEYAVDGEINTNTTDLQLSLLYDYDGYTQNIQKIVNGSDESILQGILNNNSLAQSLLAQQPLGGLLTPPPGARRFHVVFETAKEDMFELSAVFETNDVDRYWAILAHGANAQISRRRATTIRK